MSLTIEQVESIERSLEQGGPDATLALVGEQLLEQQKYHELFEVRKMQTRHAHGLPLVPFPEDPEPSREVRDALDDAFLDVCREVGKLFLQAGKIQEGWMYYRPIGATKEVRDLLARIDVNEENSDQLVGVLLSEGVDPIRGFEIVLERYGTCNAITTFEGELPRRSPTVQRAATRLLVQHLYQELLSNLRHDLTRRGLKEPAEPTVGTIVKKFPELFEEHAYHIDTTHLASVVRFAKVLNEAADLRMVIELCEYGLGLSEQYQFPGDEPFPNTFEDHRRFCQVLLGEQVEAGLDFFRRKAEAIDPYTQGTMAAEVLVDLLARVGHPEEAFQASLRWLAGRNTVGVAPSLVELAEQMRDFEPLLRYCKEQDDVLGYTTAKLLEQRVATRAQP